MVTRLLVINSEPNSGPFAYAGQDQEHTVIHDCEDTNTVAITLDGTTSYDLDSDLISCEWILDGNIVSNNCIYTFDQSVGTEYYELRVTDCYGLESTDNVISIVNPEQNESPIAVLENYKIIPDTPPTQWHLIDGSESYDPAQDHIEFEWLTNCQGQFTQTPGGTAYYNPEDIETNNLYICNFDMIVNDCYDVDDSEDITIVVSVSYTHLTLPTKA